MSSPGHHHHSLPASPAVTAAEPLARGDGSGRIVFVDAFSGVAGDMLVGAFVDLGVPEEVIAESVAPLRLAGCRLQTRRVVRSSIAGCKFEVEVHEPQPARSWREIRTLLERSACGEGVSRRALAAFAHLARAEAWVHGVAVDDVHFHEVGAVDSIVDIVAVAAAVDYLGCRVVSSPLPLGRGWVEAAHGRLPLPAPATLRCLEGFPTYDGKTDVELITPTGAALIATLADEVIEWPGFRPLRIGWGAGTRELSDRPNLVRLVLGAPSDAASTAQPSGHEPYVVVEANVDDMSGELASHALARVHEAGALDTWSVPIGMKKGRPAWMLCALASQDQRDAVTRAILAETTSLGVRFRPVERCERPRHMITVSTSFGSIRVKVAEGDGIPPQVAPEFDDCTAAAERTGAPAKEVYAAAVAAAQRTPQDAPHGD